MSNPEPGRPAGHDWHVVAADLEAYVTGVSSPPLTVSVEAHLVRCGPCRAAVVDLVDPRPLQLVWDAIVDDVALPAPSLVERVGVRLGLSDRDALLVAAAPALRSSWLLGILVSLLIAVVAASDDGARGSLLFLAAAPLLPVGAVALAYGRELDPLWETSLATPYPRLRLVLIRALAVIAVVLPLTVAAGPLLPGPVWLAGAWLLPAAACVAGTLALATWFDVTRSAAGIAAGWVLLVCAVAGPGLREPLLVLAEPLLVLYLLVAVAASVVVWRRCDTFSVIGRPS